MNWILLGATVATVLYLVACVMILGGGVMRRYFQRRVANQLAKDAMQFLRADDARRRAQHPSNLPRLPKRNA